MRRCEKHGRRPPAQQVGAFVPAPGHPGASARQKLLRADLGAEFEKTRRGQLLIEVFAGSGGLSKALRACGAAVLARDLSHGDHRNVLHEDVFCVLRERIAGGTVAGVWLSVLCGTVSRARRTPAGSKFPGALRSTEHLRGLPGLSTKFPRR